MRWPLFLGLYCVLFMGCADPASTEDAAGKGENSVSDSEQQASDLDTKKTIESQQAEGSQAHGNRTHHRENRLAKETSPYLLLHKHNPVDWYPWGAEALEKAKRENKLIFLSIGYSSCHWCHVMERESFMSEEIAKILNEHFVCIKVDREERPDVDDVYMTALHVMGQQGGWPLSIFLVPDAKPLIGGTYIPPKGFEELLGNLNEQWETRREVLTGRAEVVANAVRETMRARNGKREALDPKSSDRVLAALAEQFDSEYGGFRYSEANPYMPKFPEPSNLLFLLDLIERETAKGGDKDKIELSTKMLTESLSKMAAGGIWDHVGGGFHRYSTDRFWRVPHFEKMLYDNGQLASVYARAYALTGNVEFRNIVDQIIAFSDREMRHSDGGYFAALDAESDGKEGGFYIWQLDEVREALSEDDFALATDAYELGAEPNFRDPHSGDTAYVFVRRTNIATLADELGLELNELTDRFESISAALFKKREPRKRPLLDTKILTSWNGMMIRGLADAGRFLKEPKYTESAERTARFVLEHLRTDEGRLLRTHTDGEAKLNAYLVDYAYLIDGLIALHEATGNQEWLNEADALMATQLELFADKVDGGFFFTSDDHESLYARSKRAQDGARPSGNSVTAENLAYLGRVLKKQAYLDAAKNTVLTFAGLSDEHPTAMPRMVVAEAELLRSEE